MKTCDRKSFQLSTIVIGLVLMSSMTGYSQIQVGGDATLTINSTIATNNSIINNGSLVWNSNSLLFLNGGGDLQTGEGTTIQNLKINGTYQLSNSINVANSLILLGGTLTPIENAQLLLLNGATISTENEAFIAGILYHQGTGEKFYPLGKNGVYTPVTLFDVQGSEDVIVGLEAFNESLAIDAQIQDWFWEITTEGDFEGSLIQLPILDPGEMTFTVMQSDGSNATDLGGDPTDAFTSIRSQRAGIGPYFLIGAVIEEPVALTIHNIVTPDLKDGRNDAFYIENIDRYPENTVILMDRWGTEVCRMENFSNDPVRQQDCNLDRLPAGNYTCMVNYDGKHSTPVMITILK